MPHAHARPIRSHAALPCSVALLLALSAPLRSQQPVQWLESVSGPGIDAGGWGFVTETHGVRVNSIAAWMQESDTDHSDPASQRSLMRSNQLLFAYSNHVAQPPGATIAKFVSFDFNYEVDSVTCFELAGVPAGSDRGLYVGPELALLEGWPVLAPGSPSGTVYRDFQDARINDAGRLLARVTLEDAAAPGVAVPALVRALSPFLFAGTGEQLVARAGDLLPGQSTRVVDIGFGQAALALDEANRAMYRVRVGGDPSHDVAVYIDSHVVAQEGESSPLAGRAWSDLSSAHFDLGDGGDWVLRGVLSGASADAELIARNGQKLVQAGDSPAAIAPYQLVELGNGGVHIDELGRVLWLGRWNDPDPSRDEGLFLDTELIAREGVSTLFGVPLGDLAHGADNVDLSPDGKWIVFKAHLPGLAEWSVLRRGPAGLVETLTPCQATGATLSAVQVFPTLANPLDTQLDGAQTSGALGVIAYALQPASGGATCGVTVPGLGELWLDPSTLVVVKALGAWSGAPLAHALLFPPDIALAGLQLYAQGAFVDALGMAVQQPIRLSNGLHVQLAWGD